MLHYQIKTPEDMIDYLIDCTLATVESMCLRKSVVKSEFERQCNIAQKAIDFLGPNHIFKSRAEKFAKTETAFKYYSRMRENFLAEPVWKR